MSIELGEWGFRAEMPAGKMKLRNVTYITWLGDDMVTVPISQPGCAIFAGAGNMTTMP